MIITRRWSRWSWQYFRYDRLRLVRTPVGLVGAIKEAVIKHWSVLVILTIIVIRFTDSDHTIIINMSTIIIMITMIVIRFTIISQFDGWYWLTKPRYLFSFCFESICISTLTIGPIIGGFHWIGCLFLYKRMKYWAMSSTLTPRETYTSL